MYINGHFCYTDKFAILTNNLGIVRHIAFTNDASLKDTHPELTVGKNTGSPDEYKSVSDVSSLAPVLSNFLSLQLGFLPDTFLGDSSFDSATPGSTATWGRTTYTYENIILRMFTGIQQGSLEWDRLYKIRTIVERAINHFKINMYVAGETYKDHLTMKADVLLAGIANQLMVIVAHRMKLPDYLRSLKPLIA